MPHGRGPGGDHARSGPPKPIEFWAQVKIVVDGPRP
jgi:hypothetical protein